MQALVGLMYLFLVMHCAKQLKHFYSGNTSRMECALWNSFLLEFSSGWEVFKEWGTNPLPFFFPHEV